MEYHNYSEVKGKKKKEKKIPKSKYMNFNMGRIS